MRIPSELHDAIMARVATGETHESVRQWLVGQGVKVSRQAITKVVTRNRAERRDVASVVLQEHLAKTLPADLEALAAILAVNTRLLSEAQEAALEKPSLTNIDKVVKLTNVVLRADADRRKALGIEAPPDAVAFTGLADLVGLAL